MNEETKVAEKREYAQELLKKVKLHDAGRKIKPMKMESVGPSVGRVSYPSMYFNAEQVPELSKYEVGDTVHLVIEGTVDSHSLDDGKTGKHESFNVCIKKIACLKSKE